MNSGPRNVFVSYSHADTHFVAPVVSLLRATRAVVFRDADTIRPGRKWRNEIDTALERADLVVVFWCAHSRASPEVAKEYELGLRLGKDMLPVLLDGSPLPEPLKEYQFIDFQQAGAAGHDAPSRLASPARAGRSGFIGVVGTVAAIGVVGGSFVFWQSTDPATPGSPMPGIKPPGIGVPGIELPSYSAPGIGPAGLALLVGLAIAVAGTAALIRWWRRHGEGASVAVAPNPVQRELADVVRAAVVERLQPGAPSNAAR